MQLSIFLFICLAMPLCSCTLFGGSGGVNDSDMYRDVPELITSKGYPVENHYVVTCDGYILGLQRIPHGRCGQNGTVQRNGTIVLLWHGLLSGGQDWVFNFPNQSLGFILADAGYDVWIGNSRGNKYSRNHTCLNPDKDKKFWDFSFDEMAKYDLPAAIDYILNITGKVDLCYVGHSQGTSIMFALLAQCPEYNIKINIFLGLAPVTAVGNMKSPIRYLTPFTNPANALYYALTTGEFLQNNEVFTQIIATYVCDTPYKKICSYFIFFIFGYDPCQLNETRLGVYAAHYPTGSSFRCVAHYGQLYNSKKFCAFDFGPVENGKRYCQETPPEYNVSRITAPVALFWGWNDLLAVPEDVALTAGKLQNLVGSYPVNFTCFNHGDFVLAIDAYCLLYKKLLELLELFS